jgi:hypothetical protein
MLILRRFNIRTRRIILGFAIWELSFLVSGYGLDVTVLIAVFWISLLVAPLVVVPWLLKANERKEDAQFESPTLWIGLAVLAALAGITMITVFALAAFRGDAGQFAELLVFGVIVIFFSLWMVRSASRRFDDYRCMKISNRSPCPVCGQKGPRDFDVCGRCGAIVFWLPHSVRKERPIDPLDAILLSHRD